MKRKGEVLVEAGRLAAEYLVSQGRLPPAVLTRPPNPTSPKNPNLNVNVKDIEVIELDDSESPPEAAPKGETEEMISELIGDGSEALALPIASPDDDSIYMSLGEIPLTYMRPHWDQPPPQDFDKPF